MISNLRRGRSAPLGASVDADGGAEGPTDDPDVEALRSPQIRNFPSLLLLAVGTPMLTMGDEIQPASSGTASRSEPLRFELPPPADGGSAWLRWIDTSLTSPDDILPWEKAPAVAEDHYLVQPRSLAFLVASTPGGEP